MDVFVGGLVVGGIFTFTFDLFVWGPLGLFWAPINAIGLMERKRWALFSTLIFAGVSLFTCVGTPWALYALWSLTRPRVRSLFRA
jgi:hypothetical protein